MKQSYLRGEIINVYLGEPEKKEIKGHEQGYERPCLVLKSFPHLELAIILPCTSKAPKANHFTVVKLDKGVGGLTADSYVLCHQIRTISFERILSRRGKLDTKDFNKVISVLSDTLEL